MRSPPGELSSAICPFRDHVTLYSYHHSLCAKKMATSLTLLVHDDPQALETFTTVIWIDRLPNIKQKKCWQHRAGPKIGDFKKSLKVITRTSPCVHLANSYDILFRQEQLTQSKYAFVSSNDNRNLRKYIIDFIVKITNVFSNRATSEHSATLLKFIYIVWATPKRFFVTTTWNNLENASPQKYSFRNVTALPEILSERIATVFF